MMRTILTLFLLTMTICQAEVVGEKSFSIPEIWFEHFQVPVPKNVDRETISSVVRCNKITPLVRYRLNLFYSEKSGLSATAEIVQDPTVSIQYLRPRSDSEPATPFLTAENLKGSVQVCGSFTQLGKKQNGKVRYYVVLTASEEVSCAQGHFFRLTPTCLAGIYEIDPSDGTITSVE